MNALYKATLYLLEIRLLQINEHIDWLVETNSSVSVNGHIEERISVEELIKELNHEAAMSEVPEA